MRKHFFLLLTVFIFSSAQLAQSGRKTSLPETSAAEAEKEADFSESAPRKPRPTYSVPEYSKDGGRNFSIQKQSQSAENTNIESDVVKVETNLVTMPVSVYDRSGLYIPNLQQSNFKIFEDGVEQEIAYFGTSEKPFTVVLLLDTSPSTEYKIEEIQAAATAFVDQLKPQDNVMVVEFDANIHVLTEPTGDRRKIYKAIKKADFGGGTSIYDAVDFSLGKRLSKIEGRKAIVLFTDGVDTTSKKSDYDSTLGRAEEAGALIFPIYYNTFSENRTGATGSGIRGTTAEEYALGKKYLEDLADYTGGRVFRPEATTGGLSAAFEGIAEELRRQYNIGYYPSAPGEIGQRKSIKVRVNRPKLVIRTRDSYIVGGDKKADQPASKKSR